MDKKPEKIPSTTSQDDDKKSQISFALKSQDVQLASDPKINKDAPQDAEDSSGPSVPLKRRDTTYPTANQKLLDADNESISHDDDDKKTQTSFVLKSQDIKLASDPKKTEDTPKDEGGTKDTAIQIQRTGSDDEVKPKGGRSETSIKIKEQDSNDKDVERQTSYGKQRQDTRYAGDNNVDDNHDKLNEVRKETTIQIKEKDINDKKEKLPTTRNYQRRASMFKPDLISVKDDDGAATPGVPKPAKEAKPQSVLKAQPSTSAAATADEDPNNKGEVANVTPPSALKTHTFAREIDKMMIPSFNVKSSEPYRYYKYNLKSTGDDDAKDYDFAGARPTMTKNNVSESVLHLIKICLGSGVFTMPEAYKRCGIWTALGLNIAIGITLTYCMFMLTRSAQRLYGRARVPMMLYADVAQACFEVGPWKKARKYGQWFRYMVELTIGIGIFCACCVYQICMGMALKQLVEGGPKVLLLEGNPHLETYIIILMIPCLLICMITTLKYLAPFTVVANLYVACVAVTSVYYAVDLPAIPGQTYPGFKSVPGMFEFFGICIYSMNGIGATMSIENYMEEPKKFPIVLVIGMGIVITEVTVIGFSGHFAYGDEVQTIITLNFSYRPFPLVLKIFLSLTLYVTYALNFWVAFELVWYYVKLRHPPARYWFWERIYRAMFIIIITVTAYMMPNVYHFSAWIGTLCMSNMLFIYPAIIELIVDWREPGLGFMRWRLFKFIFFILIGLVVFAGGTYFSTDSLIKAVFYKTSQ